MVDSGIQYTRKFSDLAQLAENFRALHNANRHRKEFIRKNIRILNNMAENFDPKTQDPRNKNVNIISYYGDISFFIGFYATIYLFEYLGSDWTSLQANPF